jgi:hypothetical protein
MAINVFIFFQSSCCCFFRCFIRVANQQSTGLPHAQINIISETNKIVFKLSLKLKSQDTFLARFVNHPRLNNFSSASYQASWLC